MAQIAALDGDGAPLSRRQADQFLALVAEPLRAPPAAAPRHDGRRGGPGVPTSFLARAHVPGKQHRPMIARRSAATHNTSSGRLGRLALSWVTVRSRGVHVCANGEDRTGSDGRADRVLITAQASRGRDGRLASEPGERDRRRGRPLRLACDLYPVHRLDAQEAVPLHGSDQPREAGVISATVTAGPSSWSCRRLPRLWRTAPAPRMAVRPDGGRTWRGRRRRPAPRRRRRPRA